MSITFSPHTQLPKTNDVLIYETCQQHPHTDYCKKKFHYHKKSCTQNVTVILWLQGKMDRLVLRIILGRFFFECHLTEDEKILISLKSINLKCSFFGGGGVCWFPSNMPSRPIHSIRTNRGNDKLSSSSSTSTAMLLLFSFPKKRNSFYHLNLFFPSMWQISRLDAGQIYKSFFLFQARSIVEKKLCLVFQCSFSF